MDGGLLNSRSLNRALPWIAGAVLLLGVLAFWQTQVRADDSQETFSNQAATDVGAEKTVPLPPEARQIAVRFIKTAVVRKNLRQAWAISGPGIKQNLTLQEWMTGEIPVVPYLNAAVEQTPVKVDWSYPNEVSLEVLMEPKAGSSDKPQTFFIGLKKFGTGADAKWLVNYWAPYAPPPIPSTPQ
ncbi:MAG TPA: hypothetical protein VFO03_12975 [Gaiellaceae bacterium]|nr:hypothetical protein [Gaiellaceae bacterium]